MKDTMYHLGCKVGSVRRDCILFGDPERCRLVENLTDSREKVSSNRGFVIYNGRSGEFEFTYGALGIGGPSWAIGLHELAQCGSETFLRVGTSGIISKKVKAGDIIVPNIIISDERTSKSILGQSAKLKPDGLLSEYLAKAVSERLDRYHVGPVHCKDFLYMEDPEIYPSNDALRTRMKEIHDLGALVTEMECGALFAFGMARGFKTAAILGAIDEDRDLSLETQRKAVRAAIDALKAYRGKK